jgi:hypothetical protein
MVSVGGGGGVAGMPDCCGGDGGAGGIGGGGVGAVAAGGGGDIGGGMFCAIRLPANSRVPTARAVDSGFRDFIIGTPCQNDRVGLCGCPRSIGRESRPAQLEFTLAGAL